MKYLSILALISTALAAQSFSVVSIRSGSKFQYAGISADKGGLYVGSGFANVDLVLLNDGKLYNKATGKYVNVENNLLVESDEGKSKFTFDNNYLYSEDKKGFYACPADGDKYALGLSQCSNGTPIALRLNGVKDIGDFDPSKQSPQTTTTEVKPVQTTLVTKTAEKQAPTDAPAGSFGLIAIHSGSQVQNAAIKKVDSHLHVFSVGGDEGKPVSLILKLDGTLVDQDGVGILIDSNTGEFGDINPNPWGTETPSTGFSIQDGKLAYQGKTDWKACPSAPNKFSLARTDCVGGTSIDLKVVN